MQSQSLIFTPGDPAGVGLDLAVHLITHCPQAAVIMVADPVMLQQRAEVMGVTLPEVPCIDDPASVQGTLDRPVCWPLACPAPVRAGQGDPAHAGMLLQAMDRAVASCTAGHTAALLTGPVNKEMINEAGHAFTGHTEYLADACGCDQVVMMLSSPKLRVALVTTHLALSAVPAAITEARLERVLHILHRALQRDFGLSDPLIAVCGLNPHVGDGGYLGDEDQRITIPVVERLRQQGMALRGPLAADTLFVPRHLDGVDTVLAMYHDQGLPVLKHQGFGAAINITLGLPFVRVSVDHGTAYDCAGRTDLLDTSSFMAAMDQARSIIKIHAASRP